MIAQKGKHFGNGDSVFYGTHTVGGQLRILGGEADQRKGSSISSLVESLHGSQFHGLGGRDILGTGISRENGCDDAEKAKYGSQQDAFSGKFKMTFL